MHDHSPPGGAPRALRPSRRALVLGGLGVTGLGVFGGLGGAAHLARAASQAEGNDRYFVFMVFDGGWDVLLGLDPRDPGTFRNDLIQETRIQPAYEQLPAAFQQLLPTSVDGLVLGPYANPLVSLADQITIVRGMSMDTLTHEVGRRRFLTGKPPQGLQAKGSSIATHLAANIGRNEPIPNLAARVEPANVDQPAWASELSVASVDDLQRALAPSDAALPVGTRSRISAMLAQYRDCDVAVRSPTRRASIDLRGAGYSLVDQELYSLFDFTTETPEVTALREQYNFGGTLFSGEAFAAMTSVALRSGISRVVSFNAARGLDTHFSNWRTDNGPAQQRGFQVVATLAADLASREYRDTGESWLDRTTICVYSEFSRTPLLNGAGGRDHHLTNSCLLLGGGLPGGKVIGASSDVGMSPLPVDLQTGRPDPEGDIVRPEHVLRALMAHAGIEDDVADLRVPPLRALLA